MAKEAYQWLIRNYFFVIHEGSFPCDARFVCVLIKAHVLQVLESNWYMYLDEVFTGVSSNFITFG